jgi:hypothetical protein
VNKHYELRTINEIDGLGIHEPVKPRWTAYVWPNVKGLDKGYLEAGRYAAFRIDKGNTSDGWRALNDLVGAISGQQKIVAEGSWYLLPPVEMVKALVVIRMLGADERFEICLPPEYMSIVESGMGAAEQIREAMKLLRNTAEEEL